MTGIENILFINLVFEEIPETKSLKQHGKACSFEKTSEKGQ